MKALLNKNLFKVKEGWIVTEERKSPLSDGNWYYENAIQVENRRILKFTRNEINDMAMDFSGLTDKFLRHIFPIIITIGFKLEGIPYTKLPNEAEEIAEKLSKEVAVYPSAEDDVYQGIIAGYNKAKEKYKYTEKDLISFALFIRSNLFDKFEFGWKKITNNPNDEPKNFTSLSDSEMVRFYENSKQIQEIEFETERYWFDNEGSGCWIYELKIIPDPDHPAGRVIIKSIKYV